MTAIEALRWEFLELLRQNGIAFHEDDDRNIHFSVRQIKPDIKWKSELGDQAMIIFRNDHVRIATLLSHLFTKAELDALIPPSQDANADPDFNMIVGRFRIGVMQTEGYWDQLGHWYEYYELEKIDFNNGWFGYCYAQLRRYEFDGAELTPAELFDSLKKFTEMLELAEDSVSYHRNNLDSKKTGGVSNPKQAAPDRSIAGQQIRDISAVTNEAYKSALNSFNSMNRWLNERQALSQQYGAVWNSDGDEYFEELTSCLDRLINLYPKHLGNDMYGFISTTFLFWSLRFDVYQGYDDGHCPQHNTLIEYRQKLSLPKSWYRYDFSKGEIEWQTPECVPSEIDVPFHFKGVEGYIDGFIKNARENSSAEIKAAISSATQEKLYEAFSRLIVGWIKAAARSCNGLLEVLIDDIYQDLRKRGDFHPIMLLKAITYFRKNGLRLNNGFDIVLITFGNIAAITPSDFAFAIENPDSLPPHIPALKNSTKISDVKALADDAARQLSQSGLPSDLKTNKAWKINIKRIPSAMPYDTHEEEWIDSFYLGDDGRIFASCKTLFGVNEIDFVGLTEALQWSSSFKWEKDSGGGEWAYPVAEGFSSASEAADIIVDALNTLKQDIVRRKAAEDLRQAEEAKRRSEEQRKQQEEQRRKEAQAQAWVAQGLCKFCGGKIGMFGRKCKNCGRQN